MVEFSDRKDDYLFIRWAHEVKKRDHYTCVICGARGVELNSHHLNSWADFPEERYELENGVTLCKYHHDDFHYINGKGKNTASQFEEYKKICESILKLSIEKTIIQLVSKKIEEDLVKEKQVEEIIKKMEEDYDGPEEKSDI